MSFYIPKITKQLCCKGRSSDLSPFRSLPIFENCLAQQACDKLRTTVAYIPESIQELQQLVCSGFSPDSLLIGMTTSCPNQYGGKVI